MGFGGSKKLFWWESLICDLVDGSDRRSAILGFEASRVIWVHSFGTLAEWEHLEWHLMEVGVDYKMQI